MILMALCPCVLQKRGHRVCIVEKRKLEGRNQVRASEGEVEGIG